ncbi:MAG: hypothetical protein EXS36_13950 [Pedosphaera sp.]|nr:hypothetical protein [Pedosphaera sp.]
MKSTPNPTNLTVQQMLAIQADVDGQLEPPQRSEVRALLAANPAGGVFRDQISGMRALIRRGEPTRVVSEARDFYWSQIRRQIESVEKMAVPSSPNRRVALWSRWLGWGVPVLGAAAVALVMMGPGGRSGSETAALIEGSQLEASGLVFRSEYDGVTIHWIN